jgi:4-hydroxybenzoate polyprenyltransferase
MKQPLRVLWDLFRVGPVLGWSGVVILLGIAVGIFQTGGFSLNWAYVVLGAVVVTLTQAVAHPLNDILDFETDKQAALKETGRVKVLVDGRATVGELKTISLTYLVFIAGLLTIITLRFPYAWYLGVVGLFAAVAYNVKPLMLAYRPFAEWYLGIPTVIAAILGMAYVATGEITVTTLAVAVAGSMGCNSFFAMHQFMDVKNDAVFGKRTAYVVYPQIAWAVMMPFVGIVVSVVLAALVMPLLYVTVPFFLVMIYYAFEGFYALHTVGGNFEGIANTLRQKVAALEIAMAVVVSAGLVVSVLTVPTWVWLLGGSVVGSLVVFYVITKGITFGITRLALREGIERPMGYFPREQLPKRFFEPGQPWYVPTVDEICVAYWAVCRVIGTYPPEDETDAESAIIAQEHDWWIGGLAVAVLVPTVIWGLIIWYYSGPEAGLTAAGTAFAYLMSRALVKKKAALKSLPRKPVAV